MDDYSVVSANDLDRSGPASPTTNIEPGRPHASQLLSAEQELASLQKRLAQINVKTGSESQATSEDLELLLETRGLVRYASFRIRRSRRLRESQHQSASKPDMAGPSKRQTSNEIKKRPSGAKAADMQSSIMSLDAFEDDAASSPIGSMSDALTRDTGMSGDTAPTDVAIEGSLDDPLDETITQTPKNQKVQDLANALRQGHIDSFDLEEIVSRMSESMEQNSKANKGTPGATIDAILQSSTSTPSRRTPQKSEAGNTGYQMTTSKESLDGMISTMEEDVDNFVYKMFVAAYNGLLYVWNETLRVSQRLARGASTFSGSQLFQGVVLGIILYRLFLVLAVSTENPALTATVEP